ncbi:unnamed protein product [Rotaria socialis]|uniref:Exosome complex component RRP45 n=1 Tax=Rotaria socialis TaxID=392032 RepID=A0A818CEE3_9BILA|nr:unnamed protein product [Rotaria socialis]CAF3422163.1 unnamed protein product [Rotaria socialis]CAF4302773.1 unnamed protein product [Rotaria socialis]CAF4552030.1 unnamed protein product [Rotaria socialis]
MKEFICSTIERNVVLKCIRDHKRLDCRTIDETRSVNIDFRSHPGCVSVRLGQTCVIAQASCRITKPKESRASEGNIRIHIDMSKIPLMNLENWKHQEFVQELNGILEQNIRHSNCVDLESLCINSGELVWAIKIDITVLNNCGNILDCANIATLCSLYHFRLPEVTVHGSDIRVYSSMERRARPLRILHFPINVLFAFFVDGRYTLIDPSSDEERLMDGFLSISMNQHKEICGIHMGGKLGLKKEQVDLCKKLAFKKILELTDRIRQVVTDYYKNNEPTIHTQPSIVRIEDGEDSSGESESEDSVLIKTDMSPSPMETNVSLLLMPSLDRLSLSEDNPTITATVVDKSTSKLENDDEQDNE